MFKNIKKYFTPKRLLILYFSFLFIGLFGIIAQAVKIIPNTEILDINLGHLSWYYYEKPRKIALYMIMVPITFIFSVFFYYFYNKNNKIEKIFENKSLRQNIIFFIIFSLNLLLLIKFNILIKFSFWFLIAGCIFYNDLNIKNTYNFIIKKINLICGILLTAVCIFFLFVFVPILTSPVKINNEYLNIPEISHLKSINSYVDNNDYINSHKIYGSQNFYDLRKSNDNLYDKNSIKVSNIKDFKIFVEERQYRKEYINRILNLTPQSIKTLYFIENDKLCIIGNMSKNDFKILKSIAKTETDKETIEKYYYTQDELFPKFLTQEEKEFININSMEREWQLISRGIFHHQMFAYLPYQEMCLNKNLNNISYMYGFLQSFIPGKITEKFFDFNLGNFIKVSISFYIFYFIFALLIMRFILKDIKWLYINAVALLITSLGYSYYYIYLAPGFNPFRHFLDIFVILFLYLYTTEKKKIFYIATAIFSLLSVAINIQFGIFITLSLLLTTVIKFLLKKNKFELYASIITLIMLVPIYMLSNIGEHEATSYFLYGLHGGVISSFKIFILMFSIFLLYITLKDLKNSKSDYLYTALFLLFYSQGLLLYYIICPQNDHLFPIINIIVLTLSLFIKYLTENKYPNIKNVIIINIIIITFLFSLQYISTYKKGIKQYNNIFKQHYIFHWNMPNTNFISTINPEYFKDSKLLITKYSQNKNDISIISKYDMPLLLISNKYNNLYNNDILNKLITIKEENKVINTITKNKPVYLFIDKDIERHFEQDILNAKNIGIYHYNESLWRVLRLKEVQKIFTKIKKDYEPIESSYLLTVWKRKS